MKKINPLLKTLFICLFLLTTASLSAQSKPAPLKKETSVKEEVKQVQTTPRYAIFDFKKFKELLKPNMTAGEKALIVKRLNHVKTGVNPDLKKEIELFLKDF